MRIHAIRLSVDSPYLEIAGRNTTPKDEDFASLVKELEVNTVDKKLINPHRLKARQPFMFGNFFLAPILVLQRLYYVILIHFLIPF